MVSSGAFAPEFSDPGAGRPVQPRLGRSPGDHGRIAYVTTDGGVTAPPPDGITRNSALLRTELHPAKENS